MVDEIGNLISTLFQHQKSNVNQICIFNPFQRLSNVWMIISNVDSALNKRHFARWGLGDRNRIRNPFYGEVRRDNTSEIFGLVVRVVKNVLVKEFCSPFCFHAKNKKG
jgi:ribosome-associated toxin RatA of RatAB toxin-antitoxin module